MKDNNIFYTCPYCKEEYSAPSDLAHCILSCEEKKRIEEEQAKKAKIKAEKEARYKEVIDAYDNFEELRSKYVDDYGSFTFKTEKEVNEICDWAFRMLNII